MELNSHFSQERFIRTVGERELKRFYPWIPAGLMVLYLSTFSFFEVPVFVVIPTVVAGWFYYRRGGLIASVLAIALNLILIYLGFSKTTWERLSDISNGILIIHLFFLIPISVGAGYLREEIEKHYHDDKHLLARERDMVLINMATKDILAGNELSDTYYRLLTHLTNLFTADYAYLTHWDEVSRQIFLVAATETLARAFYIAPLNRDEADLTTSTLEEGHAIFIDDVQHSPLIVNRPAFSILHNSTRSVLLIPLITKDYKFGVAIFEFDSSRNFDPKEITYIESTSYQIALALHSVQQGYKIKKQLKNAEALARIEHALSMGERIGVDAVLQLIVDSAKNLIPNTQRVVLHLLDDEQQFLIPRAVTGYDHGVTEKLNMLFGEGVAGQVIATGNVASIPDIRNDPRFINQSETVSFRSLIVVPIQSNEHRIGTISVHNSEVGAFSPEETNLLSALGAQVAIAIENANLLETTQQDFKEISTLYHLTQNLATSLDTDQLIKDTIEFLQRVFEYYHIQLYVIDNKSGNLMAHYGAGAIGNQLAETGHSLPVGAGTSGHVAITGMPFFTNSVEDVVFFVRNPLLPDTRSEMVLPIMVNGKIWGVINIQDIASGPFSQRQMKLMEVVTQQLSVALERANIHTELQTSLQQEKTMRSQLIQAERLTVAGRLLASVSHELNNPLQAIQNVLFLLKDEEKLSAQGRQDMEVILSETERMASLIGRLRDTYRSTQAGEFREVDINPLVEDVFALISTYMRHRKIAFEFIPEPELQLISGIPEQLRQILLNLFMNAIESMNKGGKVIVQTQNILEQDQILLTVADTGTGISSDVFDNIFNPFVTNKETGTGLGLAITRDIIYHHHGDIRAENNPQGGAIFRVWLPTKKQE